MANGVLVRMRDDELITGEPKRLDLDQPDFELSLDGTGNNREVLIPFAAVKSILLQRRDPDGEVSGAGTGRFQLSKVIVRFRDGEVVKGYLHRGPVRCRSAMQLELINATRDAVEVLAIPHNAIKGIFYVKAWDGRAGEFVRETGHWEARRGDTPLVDLLGEIQGLRRLRADGQLSSDEFERRRRVVLDRI